MFRVNWTMDHRAATKLLKITSTLFVLGSVAAVAWALLWPYETTASLGAKNPKTSRVSHDAAPQVPPLRVFETVWELNLRTAMYDNAAPGRVQERAAFPAKLSGTIIEPGNSQAMFITATGVEFKSVGDTIADAQVVEITANSVTVLYQGDRLTLVTDNQGGR